jgi:hypothetical protein
LLDSLPPPALLSPVLGVSLLGSVLGVVGSVVDGSVVSVADEVCDGRPVSVGSPVVGGPVVGGPVVGRSEELSDGRAEPVSLGRPVEVELPSDGTVLGEPVNEAEVLGVGEPP